MYLQHDARYWACDIEADNLLDKATTIWCCTALNLVTKERKEFFTADEFIAWYTKDMILIGHNFIAYDAVMLNRFWKANIPIKRIIDTFVLSQLYNPSYKGGHSLQAWGERLRYEKGDHSDFSRLTPEMLRYCHRDTALTALLYIRLTERMRQVGFSEKGCELEHLAWNIIQNKQKRNGFPLDYERAHTLYTTLRAREEELKREIYRLWPPRLEVVGEYKACRKRDGSFNAQYQRHLSQFPRVEISEGGGYQVYDYVAFNLGSPTQRIEKLLSLGWEPTQFTKKTDKGGGGNPKVDEDQLLDFAEKSGKPEVAALAKWIVVNSRANMINTWMEAYNHETKAIHGSLFIASTLRYRHSIPNSANIPAVRLVKYGDKDVIQYGEAGGYSYEARDLWTCGDEAEWSLVGIDGKGIQLRVLANYAYSEEFVERVLAGDPHTNNIKILGLANKAAAKKFLYTTLMGGGGAKLAVDQAAFGTKLSASDGNRLKNMLIDSIPGFKELIRRLEKELEDTGRIRLCDDTPILVPSPHMVIPYLLQGDESRLMKQAMVYVDEDLRKTKLSEHCLKVADIHDEWQYRVRNDYVMDFVDLALPCFPRAGDTFEYRLCIEGDYKVGKTWAETH